jgi:hypothetical protein
VSGLSKREAARRWSKARATIDRDVVSGKLSLTADKLIDPAEMIRVYGEPKSQQGRQRPEASEPDEAAPKTAEKANETMALEVKLQVALSQLELERAERERERTQLQQNLADLRSQLQLLTHDRPAKKRRWWQVGLSG